MIPLWQPTVKSARRMWADVIKMRWPEFAAAPKYTWPTKQIKKAWKHGLLHAGPMLIGKWKWIQPAFGGPRNLIVRTKAIDGWTWMTPEYDSKKVV